MVTATYDMSNYIKAILIQAKYSVQLNVSDDHYPLRIEFSIWVVLPMREARWVT